MQNSTFIRRMASCPECGQTKKALFYVLDQISVGRCEHCGQMVEFRRPHDPTAIEGISQPGTG